VGFYQWGGVSIVNGDVRRLELQNVFLIDNLERYSITMSSLAKIRLKTVAEKGEHQIQMDKDLTAVGKRDRKLSKMNFVGDGRAGVVVLLEVMVSFGTGEWVKLMAIH